MNLISTPNSHKHQTRLAPGFFMISIISLTFYLLLLQSPVPADAHFGMIIPSDNMVMQADKRTIDLALSFSHPFEGQGMVLDRPAAFDMYTAGKKHSLLSELKPAKVMEYDAFSIPVNIRRPGIYSFVMTPQPYWEPAEDCFIIHITKTVVTAFGDDDGWDAELGLETEIVPLSKPYGLYAGNLFQGIVKVDGKPVPFAEVEIEYYNQDNRATAPTDYMVTQTIKADANGVFSYCAPRSGWWGFAALSTSDKKKMHNGQKKDIELGAVIWVKFENWQEN